MTMLAGTPAVASLLAKETVILPGAAAASNTTVPVEFFPPTTVVGLSVSDSGPIGRTFNVAFTDAPSNVAVTLPVTVKTTAIVVMVKFAVVLPARMVTDAGTVAAVLALARLTTISAD